MTASVLAILERSPTIAIPAITARSNGARRLDTYRWASYRRGPRGFYSARTPSLPVPRASLQRPLSGRRSYVSGASFPATGATSGKPHLVRWTVQRTMTATEVPSTASNSVRWVHSPSVGMELTIDPVAAELKDIRPGAVHPWVPRFRTSGSPLAHGRLTIPRFHLDWTPAGSRETRQKAAQTSMQYRLDKLHRTRNA